MVFKPLLLLLTLNFLASGCSGLLYYPTQTQYFDPRDLTTDRTEVFFRAEDKTHLNGWYFKVKKPKALIVFFHGNAQNLTSHFAALHWVQEFDYNYFIFDYRGYGKSSGKPDPKGTVMDGKAAIEWAHKKASALKVPLVVYGQSLGGAIAQRSVYELRDKIKVPLLVADSTFSSYQSVGRRVLAGTVITWPFQWLSYLLLSDEYAPGKRISELKGTEILVIHGQKDHQVTPPNGEEIYEMAPDPKTIWRIEDGKHIDVFWRHERRYRKKFVQFLDKRFAPSSTTSKKKE